MANRDYLLTERSPESSVIDAKVRLQRCADSITRATGMVPKFSLAQTKADTQQDVSARKESPNNMQDLPRVTVTNRYLQESKDPTELDAQQVHRKIAVLQTYNKRKKLSPIKLNLNNRILQRRKTFGSAPDANFLWACAAVFAFFPIGIFALYRERQAQRAVERLDYSGAKIAARKADRLSSLAVTLGVLTAFVLTIVTLCSTTMVSNMRLLWNLHWHTPSFVERITNL